jgi:hypothetical protein
MDKDVAQTTDRPGALSRRDMILLPLISLLTIIILSCAAEIGARIAWPEQKMDSCLAIQGTLGPGGKPNCVSRTKAAEGPWVENHYNDCGLLSSGPCHAPPAGAVRLALVGSSIGFGYLVPYAETIQGRATVDLARMCGRPIDIQNYAGVYNLNESALRAPEVAAIHPAAAVMVVDPMDLVKAPLGDFVLDPKAHLAAPPRLEGADAASEGLRKALDFNSLKAASRAAIVAEHFLFNGGQSYLQLYLRNGDKADFLRPPFTPVWRQRLAVLDRDLGYMADTLHASGTPLIVVFAPQQAQAEILAGQPAPGTDPRALAVAIGDIAKRHGAVFVDANQAFHKGVDAAADFYPVDGHYNGKGQGVLAGVVEQALIGGDQPIIPGCRAS